jgi:iron complex transport system ATP-binding protein
MARLEARGLGLRAGDKLLVRGLSVAFAAGENWAILGANGSGKSTLLHTLAGLRPADEGQVRLDDEAIQNWPRRKRAQTLGLLFQEPPPAFPATVLETVLSGRHPHLGFWDPEGPADLEAAGAALAATGLAGFERRSLPTLSGGERRRVELAALFAQDPPLCLLDEPANHLDPHHQIELLRRVCARTTRPGHLNLLVLHDVNLALRFCSHGLLLLPDGDSRHGPLDALLDRPLLEAVYGCPMRELRTDAGRIFFPD